MWPCKKNLGFYISNLNVISITAVTFLGLCTRTTWDYSSCVDYSLRFLGDISIKVTTFWNKIFGFTTLTRSNGSENLRYTCTLLVKVFMLEWCHCYVRAGLKGIHYELHTRTTFCQCLSFLPSTNTLLNQYNNELAQVLSTLVCTHTIIASLRFLLGNTTFFFHDYGN